MNKRAIKILFLITTLVCITFTSQLAFADTEGGYNYTISGGEATITSFASYKGSREVVIPDTLGGCPVVAIESTYTYLNPVETLVLPDTLRYIGDNCFMGWTDLTDLKLPQSLVHIGKNAFSSDSRLTTVNLPDAVEYVGDFAFYECSNLREISISSDVEYIGEGAFAGSQSLTDITVDENNEYFVVYDKALYDISKTKLILYPCDSEGTSYTVPDTVKILGYGAFSKSELLEEISIPAGLREIGKNAFYGCIALKEMMIPKGVTKIEDGTFNYCHALKSITLPKGITYLGEYSFALCTSLKEITLPETVQTLGNFVFSDCTSLEKLVLPHGVKNIPLAVVSYGAVTELYVPASVETMDSSAFLFSPVTDIYYSGTESEWNQIEGVEEAMTDSDITVHYNTNPIAHTRSTVTTSGNEHTVSITKRNFTEKAHAVVMGFNGGTVAQISIVPFDGESTSTTLTGTMDTFKVIILNSMEKIGPLCVSEVINIDEVE